MAKEEADTLEQQGDDMPLTSPDFEEPASPEASDEPAEEADVDDIATDEAADEQSEEQGKPSPDDFKEPGFQKGYTKGTQKWAGRAKELEARAAAAEAEREALRAQLEFAQQRAAQAPQTQQDDDPVDPAHVASFEKLMKRTDVYKRLEADRATLRSVMASKPEAFLEANDVDPDILAEITPQLRQVVAQQEKVDPQTIRIIAKNLAAPKQAELIRQFKAEKAALSQARAKKAAKMKQAQLRSSGNMGTDGTVDLADADNETLGQVLADPNLWKQELGQ